MNRAVYEAKNRERKRLASVAKEVAQKILEALGVPHPFRGHGCARLLYFLAQPEIFGHAIEWSAEFLGPNVPRIKTESSERLIQNFGFSPPLKEEEGTISWAAWIWDPRMERHTGKKKYQKITGSAVLGLTDEGFEVGDVAIT